MSISVNGLGVARRWHVYYTLFNTQLVPLGRAMPSERRRRKSDSVPTYTRQQQQQQHRIHLTSRRVVYAVSVALHNKTTINCFHMLERNETEIPM